jgi:hypothetical protein
MRIYYDGSALKRAQGAIEVLSRTRRHSVSSGDAADDGPGVKWCKRRGWVQKDQVGRACTVPDFLRCGPDRPKLLARTTLDKQTILRFARPPPLSLDRGHANLGWPVRWRGKKGSSVAVCRKDREVQKRLCQLRWSTNLRFGLWFLQRGKTSQELHVRGLVHCSISKPEWLEGGGRAERKRLFNFPGRC